MRSESVRATGDGCWTPKFLASQGHKAKETIKMKKTQGQAVGTILRAPDLKMHILRERPIIEPPTLDPDDYMVGFVPVLPANRSANLIYVDGHMSYTDEYKANYYTLRDAIERDQYDRRGGYRMPYKCKMTALFVYVYSNKKPLHSTKNILHDLDNLDKTFIDALSTTSRCTREGQLGRIRHLRNDSLIERKSSERTRARRGELVGVWYALKTTDFSKAGYEEHEELARLIEDARDHRMERREFDLLNLHIAERDGLAFLRGEECSANNFVDPTYCSKAIFPMKRQSPEPDAETHASPTPTKRRVRRRKPPRCDVKPRMRNGMPLL